MSYQENYSTPRLPANVNMDGATLNIDLTDERNIKRFMFRDRKDFYPLPFTIAVYNNQNYIGIASNPSEEFAWRFAKIHRTEIGSFAQIPIARPLGKKALLHSVVFGAYDNHLMTPLLMNIGIENHPYKYSFVDATYRVYDKSMIQRTGLLARDYTGNKDYFDYHRYYQNNPPRTINFATYEYCLPDYPKKFTKNKIIALLDEQVYSGKSAPRTSSISGMLPNDWLFNHFEVQIIGYNASNQPRILFDNHGRNLPIDANSTNSLTDDNDEFMPASYNNLNTLIPDDIVNLSLEVARPYVYHYYQNLPDTDPLTAMKTSYSIAPPIEFTVVRFPVKVDFSILYE